MSIEFNHTLVDAKDIWAAAREVGGVLDLAEPSSYGPFAVLQFDNGVTLDFMDMAEFTQQHCAFLVSEEEFDACFERIQRAGIDYWADPFHNEPGRINHLYGGRGVYFDDPSGHTMEIITQPYGDQPPYS